MLEVQRHDLQEPTVTMKVSRAFAILSMVILVSMLLVAIFVVYCQRDKILNEEDHPDFKTRFGAFWEGQSTKNGQNPKFQIFFILRRLAYASIIILPQYYYVGYYGLVFFQVGAIICLNLFSACFVVGNLPYSSPIQNKIEAVNEFMGLEFSVLVMQFLNTTDHQQVYAMGIIGNSMILTMILFNIAILSYSTVNQMRWETRKR